MTVFVCVEGPADRVALEKVLREVLEIARANRVAVKFIALDGKSAVVDDGPRKAARGLKDEPGDWYVLLPDLYPTATERARSDFHTNAKELGDLLTRRFTEHANGLGLSPEVRNRFRAHCLKHDLEALILASPNALRARLRTKDALTDWWTLPPENQDGDRPPKRVVEELFLKYRHTRYRDIDDAPWILGKANLAEVQKACPQCFHRFVEDLRGMVGGG